MLCFSSEVTGHLIKGMEIAPGTSQRIKPTQGVSLGDGAHLARLKCTFPWFHLIHTQGYQIS